MDVEFGEEGASRVGEYHRAGPCGRSRYCTALRTTIENRPRSDSEAGSAKRGSIRSDGGYMLGRSTAFPRLMVTVTGSPPSTVNMTFQ